MRDDPFEGFGKWKDIALRLIYDDLPLSRIFFSSQTDRRRGRYCLDLVEAAKRVEKARASKRALVVPCMALILDKDTTDLMTHAVVMLTDGHEVRLFDPNGKYPAFIRYYINGSSLKSGEVVRFLRERAGAPPTTQWTISSKGIQNTVAEPSKTRYVPNRGYCMGLCRLLMECLERFAKEDAQMFPLTRTFEGRRCIRNAMGPAARRVLREIWPHPELITRTRLRC
jgi:hypothetical protein